MVDVASITVAVISLITALGVAVASGILTIFADERKARRETERLLRKYRDPLLLGEHRGTTGCRESLFTHTGNL
jgi:hypothetical protein